MKRKIRHIFHVIKCFLLYENKVTPWIYLRLCKLHIVKPYVLIYVDGGIRSQMHQYLLGRYYAEKGMNVAYDLGWYKRNGMDNNGIFERKFEFCEMWPNLPFEIATDEKVTFYNRVFPVKREGMHFPLEVNAPKYFGGYYRFDDEKAYGVLFKKYFSLDKCRPVEKSGLITNGEGIKCAVHVRRGDLANMDDYFYGKVTLDYFRRAMDYVRSVFDNVRFYFFSDELDWVEKNLIQFCRDGEYELMKGNKAWEDMALMAHCDCVISSQGSGGKAAALINGKGLLVISDDPHDAVWKERYNHTVVIEN